MNLLLLTLTSKIRTAVMILLLLLVPSIGACSRDSDSFGASAAVEDSSLSNTVQVGILVVDNSTATRDRYQPLLEELGKALDRPVAFVPVTQASQGSNLEAGKLDFIFSNPLASAKLRQLHDSEIIATVSRPGTGTAFSGLIVVSPDSPIQTLEDLKDKKGACVSMKTAAAGCLFQLYHLKQQGMDPSRELIIEEIGSQDQIVEGVIDGELDFGFIRMDQLQRMTDRGLIDSPDVVRVLEPVEDDYALPHTTALYPEWAVSAAEDTPAELVQQMQEALLNLPADNPAMANAKIEQFVPAADYSPLEALIDELNLTGEI